MEWDIGNFEHPSLFFYKTNIRTLFILSEGDWNRAGTFTKAWVGQLTVPSLTSAGRPSLTSHQLGSVPSQATEVRVLLFF